MSFEFNGVRKEYVEGVSGPGLSPWAPVEREFYEVPSMPGAWMKSKRIVKPRPLPIAVEIQGDSYWDYQKIKEDFALWLLHDEPKPLIRDAESDRIYYAVVDGKFDPEEIVSVGYGTIPFICPDPYKYSDLKELNIVVDGSKLTTLPTLYAEQAVQNVSVNISVPFKFSCRVAESTNRFSITHVESGKTFSLNYNMAADTIIEIHFDWERKRKIYINNKLQMTTFDLTSDWINMTAGTNTFEVSPTVSEPKIIYRERWQ